jgi:hypothetical protein
MRLDKAAAMQAESKARHDEAEKLLEQQNLLCDKKFLVNDCQNAAHRDYLKTMQETRRQAIEGKALEREVKQEQFREREKQRLEEAPRHAAQLRVRQAETAMTRQATRERIAASQAAKAKKPPKASSAKRQMPPNFRKGKLITTPGWPRKCAKPSSGQPRRRPRRKPKSKPRPTPGCRSKAVAPT